MNNNQKIVIIIVASACFISGIFIGRSRGIPFVGKTMAWSIGIYTGESPFNISPGNISNPILTAKDITDVPAITVADPFMVYEDNVWYMFFEVKNARTKQTDIGLATSKDALNWTYKQIVLDEPFGLSYPYVFKWNNNFYMIPESHQAESVRLYKAVSFPTKWAFVGNLLQGDKYVDSSVFYYNNKWWLFACKASNNKSDNLHLYYADELTGPWVEHPSSPIIKADANIARSGGRVLVLEDRIIRYAQDDDPTYGNQVWAFQVTKLTTTSYNEEEISESPILKASGTGWNAQGMHNIDPHKIDKKKWIACVDGLREIVVFGLEY